MPPYTTIHVGMVKGGTAANIISRECRFVWDLRNVPDDDPRTYLERFEAYCRDEVLPEMRRVAPEADIVTTEHFKSPGLRARAGQRRRRAGAGAHRRQRHRGGLLRHRGRAVPGGGVLHHHLRAGLHRPGPSAERVHRALAGRPLPLDPSPARRAPGGGRLIEPAHGWIQSGPSKGAGRGDHRMTTANCLGRRERVRLSGDRRRSQPIPPAQDLPDRHEALSHRRGDGGGAADSPAGPEGEARDRPGGRAEPLESAGPSASPWTTSWAPRCGAVIGLHPRSKEWLSGDGCTGCGTGTLEDSAVPPGRDVLRFLRRLRGARRLAGSPPGASTTRTSASSTHAGPDDHLRQRAPVPQLPQVHVHLRRRRARARTPGGTP